MATRDGEETKSGDTCGSGDGRSVASGVRLWVGAGDCDGMGSEAN